MNRIGRLSFVAVLAGLLLGAHASRADAQQVPFAFVIDNGWQAFYANPVVRAEHALTSWSADQVFHPITNNQKGPPLGQAHVRAWFKAVPDPFYASIGPLAGVVILPFDGFRAHLALLDTPAGLKTTIAVVNDDGQVNPAVSGVWALGNGAGIGGATANDMVITGLVNFGTAISAGTIEVPAAQYFPTVPFPSDANPQGLESVNVTTSLGSHYAFSEGRPVRTYRRNDAQGNRFFIDAWLFVMHTQNDDYAVAVCSHLAFDQRCSLSGTGSFLSRLTGTASLSFLQGFQWKLVTQVFFAP